MDVKNVIFVKGRGMIEKGQIENLKNHKFHYITAISKKELKRAWKDFNMTMEEVILDLSRLGLLEVKTKEGIRYQQIPHKDTARAFEKARYKNTFKDSKFIIKHLSREKRDF